MADFAAVLKKTLEQMGETSPEARGKVYDKARDAVRRQIDSMEKTPPQVAVDRQFEKLEEAINSVETEYAPDAKALELDTLLDDVVDDTPNDETVVAAEEQVAQDDNVLAPEEDIDPEIAKEADADSELELEEAAEPAPMPTPDEVVAEVTTVSPEEMAQFADEQASDSDHENDPLADFINEHSDSSQDEASIDEAAEDLKTSAGVQSDDVLGEITPERETDAALINDTATAGTDDGSGGGGRLIKILVVLGVLGGGGYYAYANQETVKSWWQGVTGGSASMETGDSSTESAGSEASDSGAGDDVPVRTVTTTTVEGSETAENSDAATGDVEPPAVLETVNANTEDQQPKFTQRLTEDGTEVDEGPAQPTVAAAEVAEGSSVAEQSADSQDAAEADNAPDTEENAAVVVPEQPSAADSITGTPVGQRAIFYEERTGSQEGTALAGATIWSIANEAPGGELPVEAAIRAKTTIPELGIEMEMTIRRNGDLTFPASHIVELFFTVPETFEGRGIADVQRVTFKSVEQDPGNALIAVPAPIDENIFMIALTDAKTAVDTNVNLMKREKWIDIPMQYTSGRRALITLEKGIPGERVFNEVFAAWESAPIN